MNMVINVLYQSSYLCLKPNTKCMLGFSVNYWLKPTSTRNVNCFMHTSSSVFAGHSKWANIRHIKEIKDRDKSIIFSRFTNYIRAAAREPGGTNPEINSKLARVLEQARSMNIPASTIQQTLKNIEKAVQNAENSVLSFVGSGGVFVLVDVLTDKINRTRNELSSICKKANLKFEKGKGVENTFKEQGIIITAGSEEGLPLSVDHAIEIGAEEVTFEDGDFVFLCSTNNFIHVKNGLQKLNYDIKYADVDKIPSIIGVIRHSDVDSVKTALTKLEAHPEVIRIHKNFDL